MKSNTSERLKQVMAERNLRQSDIVRLCEPYCKKYDVRIGRNDISQYVSGKVQPKQDKLTILGLALNISEVWLMGYDVSPVRDDLDTEFSDELGFTNERARRWLETTGDVSLSDAEFDKMLEYLKFVVSQRGQ